MKKIEMYRAEIEKISNGKFVIPPTCELDLTNLCQLDCEFCFYKKRRLGQESLEYDRLMRLFDEFCEAGVKSITFTGGGEPLVHPFAYRIMKQAIIRGLEVGLITNGVNLNKIEDPSLFKFIRVSLDAADSLAYRQVKGKDYYHKVIANINKCINLGGYVGISFVVYERNVNNIRSAKVLANMLAVEYIQFKPAWINGHQYDNMPHESYIGIDSGVSIHTNRIKERDEMACNIAGLVGIVGADGGVYYCCQHRGLNAFKLGSIYEEKFIDIWKRRGQVNVDVKSCPHCRYMNYVVDLEEFPSRETCIDNIEHKNFL